MHKMFFGSFGMLLNTLINANKSNLTVSFQSVPGHNVSIHSFVALWSNHGGI